MQFDIYTELRGFKSHKTVILSKFQSSTNFHVHPYEELLLYLLSMSHKHADWKEPRYHYAFM
jgi:hypothetical protein